MTRKPKLPPSERMALTVEEAAAQFDVSRSQAYALVKRGEWPSVRVGNVIRIPRLALDAWIEHQLQKGA